MHRMIYKFLIITILVSILVSCSGEKKKELVDEGVEKESVSKDLKEDSLLNDALFPKTVVNQISSDSIKIFTEHNLYSEDYDLFFEEGMKAVRYNDVERYTEVITRFFLSRKPTKGISIAMLMAQKNGYGKAYFDVAEFILIYSGQDLKLDDDILFLLTSAKKHGYTFDKVYVGDTIVYYKDL